MGQYLALASEVISRCRILASHSQEPGFLTRTFLSEPMRSAHAEVRRWMEQAGMTVRVDDAGNLRGRYSGAKSDSRRLIIGSHLDTVPDAGAFDGALGVLLGVALVKLLDGRRLKFSLEVTGFSEEEGIRFGVPFIGSRALVGELDDVLLARRDAQSVSVSDAIRQFGLDPSRVGEAAISEDASGYLEFHIEQGPVLESLSFPLGIVGTIVGQSRVDLQFDGQANHAGTTPMHLRRDALAGAAEWIGAVEREAAAIADLVATIGRLDVRPGARNVIPGSVNLSLDVRHPNDNVRREIVDRFLGCAGQIAARRGLSVSSEVRLDQQAVTMDACLTDALADAVERSGYTVHRMNSGAGHDAMILARRMPAAMLFLRSPGGISHHPNESVLMEDVAAALATGMCFLEELERSYG
jgi:allantoate deiminase